MADGRTIFGARGARLLDVLFLVVRGLAGVKLVRPRRRRRVSMPRTSSWFGVRSQRASSRFARFDVSDAETVIFACLARSCDLLRRDRRAKRRL